MQNVPTEFDDIDQSYFDLLLPFMRQYVLPDQEGQIIVSADYNGQEMRLLAHFAEGRAAEIYRNDPKADFHNVARDILHTEAGLDLKRKPVKIVGFSLIYGAGDENLAGQLGIGKNEARHIRKMYLKSIPGLREFQDDCSSRDRVKTWGGRIIPVEPPSIDDEGRIRHWNYRLPNYLIQGSAADQTKESIIRYHSAKLSRSSFMLTVHDENDTSCWPEDVKEEVTILRHSMESLEGFDVPFIAEVETGTDWHNLEKFNG
jgi:DNA polymerase-1